jgi:hypothetical protein
MMASSLDGFPVDVEDDRAVLKRVDAVCLLFRCEVDQLPGFECHVDGWASDASTPLRHDGDVPLSFRVCVLWDSVTRRHFIAGDGDGPVLID